MGRGRGVSYGGGQSSLSYLFGGGGGDEAAAAPAKPAAAAPAPAPVPAAADGEKLKGIPAGVRGNQSQTNNYFRAQGQNCGNFLTVSQPDSQSPATYSSSSPFVSALLTSLPSSATAWPTGPPVDQGARRAGRRLVAWLPLRRRTSREQVM
jgi:protein SPIRAL1 and related proteins